MKALLIDDHPLVLSALGAVLERLTPDVVAVGVQTARAAREAMEADGGFDLVLLDLQLGDADGFEALIVVAHRLPRHTGDRRLRIGQQ